MKKIKIMHVITDDNIGGAGKWVLNFLEFFNREKFKTFVILSKKSKLNEYLEKYTEDDNIEVINLNGIGDKSFDKADIKKFQRVFDDIKPDIVHTHASLSARIAAKRSKVKFKINTKHCMEFPEKNVVKKIIKRTVYNRYCDRTIACAKEVKRALVVNMGLKDEAVTVVYNGVKSLSKLSDNEIKALRKKYGVSDDEYVVGAVARLEDVKDIDTFVNGANEVLKIRTDVKFLIAGVGSLEEELKEKVIKLGIEKNVIFVGFIKDVEAYENILDILVNSSKSEALCIAILECMSIGVPTVATSVGGVPEIITSGKSGELYAVGDYKTLAVKITSLLDDKDRYKKYSENSVKIIKEKFSLEKVTRELEDIYIKSLMN